MKIHPYWLDCEQLKRTVYLRHILMLKVNQWKTLNNIKLFLLILERKILDLLNFRKKLNKNIIRYFSFFNGFLKIIK